MRIQLWSYNYDPEPQGIAPLSGVVARALAQRGHEVVVVAAHPHYPEPVWGRRRRPYRERRDGLRVLRLPLWIGRGSGVERVRQELSFAASQAMVAPILPACDALIAVSPCFPALAVAMGFSRARGVPWVQWLQDIVTDAAASTGLLDEGPLLRAARAFERRTYASADRVIVISEAFRENLRAKGVAEEKLVRIFNPMTRDLPPTTQPERVDGPPRLLAMGNIGYSQGLDGIVEAFEASADLARLDARLVIAGHGVEAEAVRARIRTERVLMRGVLLDGALDAELRGAQLGVVSQRADVAEFNLPSKLMNYMAYGLPVLASVRPESETARIVRDSGGGWVCDACDPAAFARTAAEVLARPDVLGERRAAARAFAERNFRPADVARR
ncbi:MAG: glycosyltransferase family 4 protein, partial [Actinomycetota bacterium]|nr:glycosyltransferase family 4 protein [Actinomycetota bacterium]